MRHISFYMKKKSKCISKIKVADMCNADEHACLYKDKKSIMHNKEKDKIISGNN